MDPSMSRSPLRESAGGRGDQYRSHLSSSLPHTSGISPPRRSLTPPLSEASSPLSSPSPPRQLRLGQRIGKLSGAAVG
ncbi:hypothetical protein KIPB_014539, partial [Kipferlia bialata]|eukprot:g14539.t1